MKITPPNLANPLPYEQLPLLSILGSRLRVNQEVQNKHIISYLFSLKILISAVKLLLQSQYLKQNYDLALYCILY